MNKIIMSLICVTPFITCFSCTDTESTDKVVTLLPSIKKIFILDDSSKALSIQNQVFENDADDKSYFTFLNVNLNSIDFFELETSRFSHRIKFEKEGPNGIGTLGGYLVHTVDSIFVVRENTYLIYLMKANKVINKYDLLNEERSANTSLPWVQSGRLITKIGDLLVLAGVPDDTRTIAARKKAKNMITLNIQTKKVNRYLDFPSLFLHDGKPWSNYYSNFYYCINFSKNSILYSFAAYENIIESNLSFVPTKEHLAQSQFIDKIRVDNNPYSDDTPFPKAFFFYGQQPSYGAIIYDQYREVYYRFATYPQKKTIKNKEVFIGKNTIIILDKNLKKIGKIEMDSVYKNNCFVTPQGLFIQHHTDIENQSVFERYDLDDGKGRLR